MIATEYLDDDSVVVGISDNGTGIAPESQEKMFETFFTTKPRGVGTGLGLAIGREIIVKKHGGTINFWSEVGTGTEFSIALPIKHEDLTKIGFYSLLLLVNIIPWLTRKCQPNPKKEEL